MLEIYEDLRRRGFDVKLFSPFVDLKFAQSALETWRHIISDPGKVRLDDYDLVIVLHQAASRFLHLQDEAAVLGNKRPFFAYLHLSPFEPFEAPGLFAQKQICDATYANSEETRAHLLELGFANVELFENPSPSNFQSTNAPSPTLESVLSVSSHLPEVLEQAFEILSGEGVDVYRIGKGANPRRVRPHDLWDHDAVVTIGKTVQYGFCAQRPVFCYDHFQGPGWIGPDFAKAAATNFSGRNHRITRTPEQLAAEVLSGYGAARTWALSDNEAVSERFHLEHKLDDLIAKVRAVAGTDRTSCDRTDMRSNLRLESKIYEQVDSAYQKASGIRSPVVSRPLDVAQTGYPITSHWLCAPTVGEATIIAAFSYRHDAHLVPGLLENIGPAIHGYVVWDDRAASEDEIFSDETIRQGALFQAAKAMGADWIFAVDPDERFEDRLAQEITALTTTFGPVVWTFECREMFHPTKYRIDGLWGHRARARLFPCLPGMEPDQQKLHGHWTQNALRLDVKASGLNFYHLRMISSDRRALRLKQYALLDPGRGSQDLGYDYLDDERGMVLQDIPEGRHYSPLHIEDNDPWQPLSPALMTRSVAPDPVDAKLHRLKTTWERGGYANAAHLARDMSRENPVDQELALWAADSAARAGLWDMALDLSQEVARADPESLMARSILARAHIALGDLDMAAVALAEAEALAPGSLHCAQIREALDPAPARFSRPDALWRRWTGGAGQIFEGDSIADCSLSVVVLSMGAPPELETAVRSLCMQSVVPEIVVVNSNGGDILGRLSALRDRVRIITVDKRLYAGAVRNIGIDASCGDHVSFLASDHTLIDGSIERRLETHQSGARAVSAYVIPEDRTCINQNAAAFLLHSCRLSRSVLSADQKYSLSYDRSIFEDFGYFSTGLRISEDTYLNRSLARFVDIASDDGIVITHCYESNLEQLTKDIGTRARRRVHNLYFPVARTAQELRQRANDAFDVRLELASKSMHLQRDRFDPDIFSKIKSTVTDLLQVEREATFDAGLKLVEARQMQRAAFDVRADDRESAIGLAQEAVALFPELPTFSQTLADVVGTTASGENARKTSQALANAAAVDPGNAHILLRLMECFLTAGDDIGARQAFERACLAAPRRKEIWARHAPLPGDPHRPMRVFSLQRMFFLDPFDQGTVRTLAENYRHAGNEPARNARLQFTQSLGK